MKKTKNLKINSFMITKLQAEATQVALIEKQIEALKVKLFTIKDENVWLNYFSSSDVDSIEKLTEEEQMSLSKSKTTFNRI